MKTIMQEERDTEGQATGERQEPRLRTQKVRRKLAVATYKVTLDPSDLAQL